MRFIADENIPASLIKIVRQKGSSIRDIKEEGWSGIKDKELMEISKREKRVIITFDKDFASYHHKSHGGVILLRYKDKSSKHVAEQFGYFLDSPLKDKAENVLCEIFDNYVKVHKE